MFQFYPDWKISIIAHTGATQNVFSVPMQKKKDEMKQCDLCVFVCLNDVATAAQSNCTVACVQLNNWQGGAGTDRKSVV